MSNVENLSHGPFSVTIPKESDWKRCPRIILAQASGRVRIVKVNMWVHNHLHKKIKAIIEIRDPEERRMMNTYGVTPFWVNSLLDDLYNHGISVHEFV